MVAIQYICSQCGSHIDTLYTDHINEKRLGFDCLTDEERQAIIKVDMGKNEMQVSSVCDQCIEALGLAENQTLDVEITGYTH